MNEIIYRIRLASNLLKYLINFWHACRDHSWWTDLKLLLGGDRLEIALLFIATPYVFSICSCCWHEFFLRFLYQFANRLLFWWECMIAVYSFDIRSLFYIRKLKWIILIKKIEKMRLLTLWSLFHGGFSAFGIDLGAWMFWKTCLRAFNHLGSVSGFWEVSWG